MAAFLISVGAFLLRIVPYNSVFTPDGVIFPGVDPYYHLWRAKMLVENFPSFPMFDPYLSFPTGAHIPWPPGFDLLVAVAGFFGAGRTGLETWAAFLPPILAAVAVWLTWRLGKQSFGKITGLFAAAILASLGSHVAITHLGRVDHHALVPVICLGTFICAINSLKSLWGKNALAWSMGAGLLAAVSVASWSITPGIYFAPVWLMLAWQLWKNPSSHTSYVVWSISASSSFLVILAVLLTGDVLQHPWALYQPSLFTILQFLLPAVVLSSWAWSRRSLLIALCILPVFLFSIVLIAPDVLKPVIEALTVAHGLDPSYFLSEEADSVLMTYGVFSLQRAISSYTYMFLLWPVFLTVFVIRLHRKKNLGQGNSLVFFWALEGLVLIVVQQRFSEIASPAWALLLAWALMDLADKAKTIITRDGKASTRGIVLASLLTFSTIVALSPLALAQKNGLLQMQRELAGKRDLLTLGRLLGEKEAPENHTIPQEGILSGWKQAHPMLWASGMAVTTSSFGTYEALQGNKRAFSILLSQDEKTAYSKIVKDKVRFITVSSVIDIAQNMSDIAGIDKRFVEKISSSIDGGRIKMAYKALPPFAKSLTTRLWFADGVRTEIIGTTVRGLHHFQLYLEGNTKITLFGRRVPQYKIFRVVKGAKLQGNSEPWDDIQLRLDVVTNTGRTFRYELQTKADEKGSFSFTVPYSTSAHDGPCHAISPYRIKTSSGVMRFKVTNEQVEKAAVITIDSLHQ